ncbi:hypothetical protein R5R35_000974 [Gryllus longicercus]|uniref:Uncharacterized protein n=1 Tax=Gryllus longicercus TaxID=2509291 RepID=A0AAN9Z050_9ORTH
MYRPLEGTCPCDKHEVKPLEDRYRALAHKECNMLADLCGLRKEMTYLTNQIMDHRCGDAKSKWKSVSMADYVCAGE